MLKYYINKDCKNDNDCIDKPNTICNPETGRCVLRTGAVGKKIIKNQQKKSGERKSRTSSRKKSSNKKTENKCSDDKIKKCESINKICNPLTGYCVNKTGSIGIKIMNDINNKKSRTSSRKKSSSKKKSRTSSRTKSSHKYKLSRTSSRKKSSIKKNYLKSLPTDLYDNILKFQMS